LCDGSSIDVLWVESITETGDTSCDLVELNAFLASICRRSVMATMNQMEVHTAFPHVHDGGEWWWTCFVYGGDDEANVEKRIFLCGVG
jgi:hypothetical protein